MIPTTRANLADVLDSCRFIQTTCATRTFDDYQKDRMFRRAIEREFEIVGESLKRVRDDEETVFASIAHSGSIVGFRNRLTHGYDSIDDAIVWGIVSGHLPLLISEVEAALKAHRPPTKRWRRRDAAASPLTFNERKRENDTQNRIGGGCMYDRDGIQRHGRRA